MVVQEVTSHSGSVATAMDPDSSPQCVQEVTGHSGSTGGNQP